MKRIFLIAAIAAATTGLNAQTVSFGIKGGVNVTTVLADNNADRDSKVSFHAGVLSHIHIDEQFALQPELFYSGQGFKSKSISNLKANLNYINLPVLLQYMAGKGFRLETGPQVGGLIGAKLKGDNIDKDIKDNYKKVDFSWVFGAGYLCKSGLGVDARYNLGLSNIDDTGNDKVKNRGFAVGLFYQFPSKR